MCSLANEHTPLLDFPLRGALRSDLALKTTTAESPNVMAMLPGSNPARKTQYVVVSAHLDHLGTGAPINGDNIYNGALDNASGVATLIKTARRMNDTKLGMSVLLDAVCGEEKGLPGCRYFATHLTVTNGPMVANINVDMFLPLFPLERWFSYELEESTPANKCNRQEGVACDTAARSGTESQHLHPKRSVKFCSAGRSIAAVEFGYTSGSREEKTGQAWLHHRYHGPADDAKQPVDLEAAAKFSRIKAELLEQLAMLRSGRTGTTTASFPRFERKQ